MAKQYTEDQVAMASLRNTRIPERKARFVVDAIRGRTVSEAMAMLRHMNRPSAAPQVERLLKSAVSNVSRAEHPDPDVLVVGQAWVDGGPVMKRWRPRAYGRASQIRKSSCHVTLVLTTQ